MHAFEDDGSSATSVWVSPVDRAAAARGLARELETSPSAVSHGGLESEANRTPQAGTGVFGECLLEEKVRAHERCVDVGLCVRQDRERDHAQVAEPGR